MALEHIGFYTLTDARARTADSTTPISRAEIILTSGCNFKCPYCRELRDDATGVLPIESVKMMIDSWPIKNIRFSGGEPTTYPKLLEAVAYAKEKGVERIAISTNGSADFSLYQQLIEAGANDFSISLDACCSSTGDMMAGVKGQWEKVIDNIRRISALTYTTVGIVLTQANLKEARETILLAHSLGVADIRVISAAQENFNCIPDLPKDVVDAHPILKYRVENLGKSRTIRGLVDTDNRQCPLVLDDVAIAKGQHYPCIIYLREKGEPIGKVGPNLRRERAEWFGKHDTYEDKICKDNCLDVCVDYNNRWMNLRLDKVNLCREKPEYFDASAWRIGSSFVGEFGMECRYFSLTSDEGARVLRKYAVGWTKAESLLFRPKANHVAVMFFKDGRNFWVHLRNNEFIRIFSER